VRYVCTHNQKSARRSPLSTNKIVENAACGYDLRTNFVSMSNRILDGLTIKKISEMNGLDRRFSVAPMMDWVESFLKSNS